MDYLQYIWRQVVKCYFIEVLNLIINGLPSILHVWCEDRNEDLVLNLIINGLPSIRRNHNER